MLLTPILFRKQCVFLLYKYSKILLLTAKYLTCRPDTDWQTTFAVCVKSYHQKNFCNFPFLMLYVTWLFAIHRVIPPYPPPETIWLLYSLIISCSNYHQHFYSSVAHVFNNELKLSSNAFNSS